MVTIYFIVTSNGTFLLHCYLKCYLFTLLLPQMLPIYFNVTSNGTYLLYIVVSNGTYNGTLLFAAKRHPKKLNRGLLLLPDSRDMGQMVLNYKRVAIWLGGVTKKGKGKGLEFGFKVRLGLGFRVRLVPGYINLIDYTYTICPMCPL